MTMPTGNSEAADPMMAGSPTDEAGANDNQLVLNPSDENFPGIDTWQDGQEYVFRELRVKQISPGKYTPLSGEGEPAEEAGAAEEGAPASEEQGESESQPASSNPAVAKMLAGGSPEDEQ